MFFKRLLHSLVSSRLLVENSSVMNPRFLIEREGLSFTLPVSNWQWFFLMATQEPEIFFSDAHLSWISKKLKVGSQVFSATFFGLAQTFYKVFKYFGSLRVWHYQIWTSRKIKRYWVPDPPVICMYHKNNLSKTPVKSLTLSMMVTRQSRLPWVTES